MRFVKHILINNSILNFVTQGWLILLFMVTTPILVHRLGGQAYGVLSIIMAIVGYFNFFDLGVSQASLKFISEHLAKDQTEEVHQVVLASILLSIILGFLGGIIISFLTPFMVDVIFKVPLGLKQDAKISFYIFAGGFATFILQGALQSVSAAFQRFNIINLINGIAGSLQALVSVWLVFSGFHLKEIAILYLSVRILSTLFFFVVMFKLLPGIRLRSVYHWPTFLKLFYFSRWIFVTYLVGPLMANLDRIMIGLFLSVTAVTYYVVPYGIVNRLGIIHGSIASVLFPSFSMRGSLSSKDSLRNLFNQSIKFMNFIMFPLILIILLFAEKFLKVWMGVDFAQKSTLVMQILAFAVMINSLAVIPYTLIQGLGRPDITAKFHLFELPLYVATCFFLVPIFGINGVAIAWAARVVLDAILLFWAVKKIAGIQPHIFILAEMKWAYLFNFIFFVCLLVIKFFAHQILAQAILIAISFILYLFFIWRYALNDVERLYFTET